MYVKEKICTKTKWHFFAFLSKYYRYWGGLKCLQHLSLEAAYPEDLKGARTKYPWPSIGVLHIYGVKCNASAMRRRLDPAPYVQYTTPCAHTAPIKAALLRKERENVTSVASIFCTRLHSFLSFRDIIRKRQRDKKGTRPLLPPSFYSYEHLHKGTIRTWGPVDAYLFILLSLSLCLRANDIWPLLFAYRRDISLFFTALGRSKRRRKTGRNEEMHVGK